MTMEQILQAFLSGTITKVAAIAALQAIGYGPDAATATVNGIDEWSPELKEQWLVAQSSNAGAQTGQFFNPANPAAGAAVNVYGPGGQTKVVPQDQVSYWLGQGWTTQKVLSTPNQVTTGEAFGPEIAYRQRMGLGTGYWNPGEQYLANLYQPMREQFEIGAPINLAAFPNQQEPTFQDWLNKVGVGAQGMQKAAQSTLGGLFGMTPEARREQGFTFEPQYDPMTGQTLPFAQTGQKGLGDLASLLQMGLGGGIGARWAASRLPDIQQRWQGQQAGGSLQENFLDYLRRRFNL